MNISQPKTVYCDVSNLSDRRVISSLRKGQKFAVIERTFPAHTAFIVSLSTIVIKGTATVKGSDFFFLKCFSLKHLLQRTLPGPLPYSKESLCNGAKRTTVMQLWHRTIMLKTTAQVLHVNNIKQQNASSTNIAPFSGEYGKLIADLKAL